MIDPSPPPEGMDVPTNFVEFGNGTVHASMPDAEKTLCGKKWTDDNLPEPKMEYSGPNDRICKICKRIWDRDYDPYPK